MNKLSNSQYITIERGVSNCWKADGLTLLSMPDKNKKKLLACSHIPIGCNLVRFHQPGKIGYDDWSVIEFFKAKALVFVVGGVFFCCCCLFCFKISLTTSAHLERKKKISPSFFLYWFTALFMVLAYPHLCYLSQIIQTFLFHFC